VATLGFVPTDFEVFKVEGFSARMEKIYAHVRPKLIRLGHDPAPQLARKLALCTIAIVAMNWRRWFCIISSTAPAYW
jgi:uncharacterized protein YktB (UPF0637 family)